MTLVQQQELDMRSAGTLLISLVAAAACSNNPNPARPGGSPGPGNVACAADNGGITLPSGFCATVFADGAGKARHIAVTPTGRVFVAIQPTSATARDGHVLALFDADGDGVAEQRTTFGDIGGNGIAWHDGALFVAANDRIVKYELPDGALSPEDGPPVVVVRDLPASGDHPAKTVAIAGSAMYVNIGSPSDSCQVANRQLRSPGKDPCPELATRAGVWQFDANGEDQRQARATRVGTGMRNTNALAIDPATGILWGAINGRDQLHENWPERYSAEQDKQLPAEEVVAVTPGTDRGWPYCYYDMGARQIKLAPEYGGNGVIQGRCVSIAPPPVALAAHAAPLGMVFTTGTQFPAAFRAGAFIANHGSRFDANPSGDLHGYDVELVVFSNGQPTGEVRRFATGFDAGLRPLPVAAPHRPVGLAMMPDGSLLIGDDKGGRIWRVFYTGT
jgi:glucose/arabinose dehydrogenase